MSKYYKIDGRYIEFADDFVIDSEAYPNAVAYTQAEMEAEIALANQLTESQKKNNLQFDIKVKIASFDYVFLGDTDGYISAEDKTKVQEYRQTLRNLLNDFANLTSEEIEEQIPSKPTITHNKIS
jgi:hypothetical protein